MQTSIYKAFMLSTAQWEIAYLTCMMSWVLSPALQKKENKIQLY